MKNHKQMSCYDLFLSHCHILQQMIKTPNIYKNNGTNEGLSAKFNKVNALHVLDLFTKY